MISLPDTIALTIPQTTLWPGFTMFMKQNQSHKIIQQTRDVYNQIAPEFSGSRTGVWNDMRHLVSFLKKGDRVVDLGCGNGRLYQLLRDLQVAYVGIDQAENLINYAKKQYPDLPFVAAPMAETGLPDASADAICAVASFHHLPSEETRLQALQEMKRVLVPGGKILMLNWNLYSDWAKGKGGAFVPDVQGDCMIPFRIASRKNLGTRYYHSFTLEELAALCEKVGLTIEQQYYMKEGNRSLIGPGDNIFTWIKT